MTALARPGRSPQEGSDRQHRFRSQAFAGWGPLHLLRGNQGSDHPIHAGHCSPICTVGHPRELDPAGDDEYADGARRRGRRRIRGSAEEMVRRRDEQCPMRRMGDSWDVAYAALFLASDEAKYITGTELVVDGGSRSTASEAARSPAHRRSC